MTIGKCIKCYEERKIMAKNLCGGCYKVEYKIKKFGHYPRGFTMICNCDAPYYQNGLCKKCFWKAYRKKEKYKNIQRKWKKSQKGKVANSKQFQRYYEKNYDKLLSKARIRWKTPHGREMVRLANKIRRGRHLGALGRITKTEWLEIRNQSPMCPMCGRFIECENMTLDHIIPLARGGTNFPSNVQALCRSCNSRKRANIPEKLPQNFNVDTPT